MARNIISLNGLATGLPRVGGLVKKRTAQASRSGNYWSCTENNSGNAWYINFGNGNFGNNNKYNGLRVRPFAALSEDDIIPFVEAFDNCCKRKKSATQCVLYRLFAFDLVNLAFDVINYEYAPSKSEAFVISRPKLREVFAASFRDRIIHHWLMIRLEPCIEQRFINTGDVSYNCRKNYGTLKAVEKMREHIEQLSSGYSVECFIGRFDISAFFMSIDVRRLWFYLESFIKENYKGEDLPEVLNICRTVVMHRPQDNCVRKGNVLLWKYMEEAKSLFTALLYIGVAIGNLTSQVFANFFFSFLDEYIMCICVQLGAKYIRFVDDFSIICNDKIVIVNIMKMARDYLEQVLGLKLHPHKVYIQEVSKGIKFVGSVIKPGRIYMANVSWGNLYNRVESLEAICRALVNSGKKWRLMMSLDTVVSQVNSYLGAASHTDSYTMLHKLLCKQQYFWSICYVSEHFKSVKISKKFQLKHYLYDTYFKHPKACPGSPWAYDQSGDAGVADQLRRKKRKRRWK